MPARYDLIAIDLDGTLLGRSNWEAVLAVETAPPVQPGPVDPGEGVDVGGGFIVFPPSGWTAVGAEGSAVFQKGGVDYYVSAGIARLESMLQPSAVQKIHEAKEKLLRMIERREPPFNG